MRALECHREMAIGERESKRIWAGRQRVRVEGVFHDVDPTVAVRVNGVEDIARELSRKRALLVPALQNRGCRVLRAEARTETASAILSFQRTGAGLAALHQRLLAAGIFTSLRTDRTGEKYIRLSPHFYNTDAELERLLALL